MADTEVFTTYNSVGNREELADVIYNIDPSDTQFLSMLRKEKIDSKRPEWQTDVLAAAASNALVEGAEYTYPTLTPTVRVGNYTQISGKSLQISGTQEVVDKAGRKSEVAYQTLKKGKELRRDQDKILLDNQASRAGTDSGPQTRLLGGFPAWLTTNAQRGTNGVDGGYNSGTGAVDASTNGDDRDFTIEMLQVAQQQAFDSGADPRILQMPSSQKRVFSGFEGISELRSNIGSRSQATIVDAADYYVGDFGEMEVVVDRFQRARDVFVIDPDMVSMLILRPLFREKAPKTGDSHRRVMITEYSLKVSNEAAHALITDLRTPT